MKQQTLEIIQDLLECQKGCRPATFQVETDGSHEEVIIVNMAPMHIRTLIEKGYDLGISAKGATLYKFNN